MKTEEALMLGGVAVAVVLAYQWLNKIPQALSAATTATGEAIGSGLYDLFHPDQVGEMLYYTVHFTNGAHAIASGSVDSQGRFTYQGVKYILKDKANPDGSFAHWAFSA